MAAKKTILIQFPANPDANFVHRLRNLGEDLWREVERSGLGSVGGIETVDCAADRLRVEIRKTRKIRTVRKLVEKLLAVHFSDYEPTITYS